MAKFKPGDTVEAKGIDGPVMQVNAVSGDTVYCYWFSGKKKEASQFHADTLQPASGKAE